MATTVGQHSVAAFTSPVNGTTPIDANSVRGNDNTVRSAYVDHDADPGIHVQSSTLASRPTAGTAGRKWITEDSGVYTLWFDDGTNWHPVSSENVNLTVLATETLVKGDVVKVTGWNNGQDLAEVAKVASTSDVAFAIITANVANGAMGYATNTGIIQDLATNAFSVGAILYPNSSGWFTATKPTSGTYQAAAYVLRSNANNGVLYVEFSAPRIVEASANTASTIVQRDASGNFAAGTITAGALTSTGLVTFASLKGTGATTVTNILDEDNMASDSATALATQQSIKAYVDAQVGASDALSEVLAIGNTTGANDIIVSAGQKIRTPAVAAQDGSSAITIANTTGALTLATALADSNLATISTAGKVSNSATTATSANTASAIVARDASGNFTAGTITAALTGNASTATTLQTARNINGVSFNGSADITVTAAAGTLTGTTLASNVTASSLTSVGTLANLTVTNPITGSVTGSSGSTTGNAATATALQTARNINGVSFNGTADITVTAAAGTLTGTTLASGVTASSLTSVGTLSSLTVSGTSTSSRLRLSDSTLSGYGGVEFTSLAGFGLGIASTAYSFRAGNGTTEYVNIASNGNLAVDTNTLYVDAANNRVGVGTTTPTEKFEVMNGAVASTNGTVATVLAYSSVGIVGTSTNHALTFVTNGTERMRLDASGNLGIGATPSAWGGSSKGSIDLGGYGAVAGTATIGTTLSWNAYHNGTNWIAKNTGSSYGALVFDNAFKFLNASTGTAGNAITFTQAMTLDASGNLGIGTTSPGAALELARTSADVGLYITRSSTGAASYRQFIDGDGDIRLNMVSSKNMRFFTSDTERARLTSGGYFKASNNGVYLNSSGNYHELRSTTSDSNAVELTNASASPYGIALNFTAASPDNNTNTFLSCGDSTTSRCFIYSDGDLANHDGVYGTISDERLKQDIVDAGSQWDDLKAVRFRKYRMKTDVAADPNAPYQLGVIAQELEQTSPGLVDEHPDFEEQEVTDEDGNVTTERVQVGTTKTVKSSILLMKAAVALQEAMARIESLEARLAALES